MNVEGTITGTRLPCMVEGCESAAVGWVTIDEESGWDINGQIHGDRVSNKHVCKEDRNDMISLGGWKWKQW